MRPRIPEYSCCLNGFFTQPCPSVRVVACVNARNRGWWRGERAITLCAAGSPPWSWRNLFVSPPLRRSRALSRVLGAAATLLLVLAAPAAADTPEQGDFDARPSRGDDVPRRTEAARDALRERLGRFGLVAEDAHTGT